MLKPNLLDYIALVFTVMQILINGSMLYGVTQKKAVFMLPWLIFGMIGIVVSTYFYRYRSSNSIEV